jgi:hypothetical protein
MGIVQDVVGLYAPGFGAAAVFALYLVIVMARPRGIFADA